MLASVRVLQLFSPHEGCLPRTHVCLLTLFGIVETMMVLTLVVLETMAQISL